MIAWKRRELLDSWSRNLPPCKGTEFLSVIPENPVSSKNMEAVLRCLYYRAQYIKETREKYWVVPNDKEYFSNDERLQELLWLERDQDLFFSDRLRLHILNDLLWENEVVVKYPVPDKYREKIERILKMVIQSLRSKTLDITDPEYRDGTIGFIVRWTGEPQAFVET